MKKRIFCISMAFLMLLTICVSAKEEISVSINGIQLETPIEPRAVNGRTMLPLRAIFEGLGATVTWIPSNELIFATKDDTLVTLKLGSYEMVLQKVSDTEQKIINLDVAPFAINNYTLVPVRAVAEALDAKVEWLQATRQVLISTENNMLGE